MLNVNETVTSIKPCYKIRYLSLKIWRYAESPYLCNVFFIVLDLRLTKDWLSGIDSLFYALKQENFFIKNSISQQSLLQILPNRTQQKSIRKSNTYIYPSRQFMNYLVLTNVYPIYFWIYFNKRRHSHH